MLGILGGLCSDAHLKMQKITEKYDPAIVEGRFIDGKLYKIWHKKLKNILRKEGKCTTELL